jgi:hypothetical protein
VSRGDVAAARPGGNDLVDSVSREIERQALSGFGANRARSSATTFARPSFDFVDAPGAKIGGGTGDIMRNILGERVSGLLKDPSVDLEMPFRELRTMSATRS